MLSYLQVGHPHSRPVAPPRDCSNQQSQEDEIGDGVADETHDGRPPGAIDGGIGEDEVESVDEWERKDPGDEVDEQSDVGHPHDVRVVMGPQTL